jgi:hypothetical protein
VRVFDSGEIFFAKFGRIEEIGDIETQSELLGLAQFVEKGELFKIAAGAVDTGDAVLISPLDTGAKCLKFFDARRFGNDASDNVLGAFLESAGGFFGLRITDDDAVGRIRSVLGNSGERESLGIGPVSVAVIAFEKNRAV